MMYGWGSGWGMGWMWVWWVFLIVAVALLLWFALGTARRGDNGFRRGESAEEVLRLRYARGEINREEYTEKLHELRR